MKTIRLPTPGHGGTVDLDLKVPSREITEDTLDAMREIVMSTKRSLLVKLFADTLKARWNGRNPYTDAGLIYDFIVKNLRFERDPRGVEVLRHPDMHLDRILRANGVDLGEPVTRGDCDENAMLGASLAMAMGHAPVFIVMKQRADVPWHHVFFGIKLADGAILPVDPQLRRQPGVWPDDAAAWASYDIK